MPSAYTPPATDATTVFTDVTTNNASTSKHGYCPKLDNDSTHFLNSQGGWTVPPGSASGDVTASGTLTASNLIIGGGTKVVSATTTGTGVVTALGVNVGSAGAVVVNGGALGTPSSGSLANCTGYLLPRGYLAGMVVNIAAGDPTNDIDVSAGAGLDSTNAANIIGTALTKQLDATWAAGTNAGGRFSGVNDTNSTWYYVFAILKDSDATVDYGFDTSLIAANRPAGYTKYRLIGFVYNDSGGALRLFTWRNGAMWWTTPALDVDVTNLSTASVSYALASVPPGLAIETLMRVVFINASASVTGLVHDPNDTDSAPSASAAPLADMRVSVAGQPWIGQVTAVSDTSQQVAARSTASSSTLRIAPLALYYDFGRNS